MEHFIKRFEALIVDVIVVMLFVLLLDNILYLLFAYMGNVFLLSIYPYVVLVLVTIGYFTLYEAKTNKTIGKRIFGLYVSDEEGYMTYPKAFIRNLTKIGWILLIPDVVLGVLLGCPSRLFDRFVGTDVYADDEIEVVEEETS